MIRICSFVIKSLGELGFMVFGYEKKERREKDMRKSTRRKIIEK
jgi:hypothetical protein